MELQQTTLDKCLFCFNPSSIYPTAVSIMDSIYTKYEKTFVFTKHMDDETVNTFNIKTFGVKNSIDMTADSWVCKIKCCHPD